MVDIEHIVIPSCTGDLTHCGGYILGLPSDFSSVSLSSFYFAAGDTVSIKADTGEGENKRKFLSWSCDVSSIYLPSTESATFNVPNSSKKIGVTATFEYQEPTLKQLLVAGEATLARDYSLTETVELPAVSTENGYTKLCDGASSLWKYSFGDGKCINVPVAEDVEKSTYSFDISADLNPFAGDNGSVVVEGFDSRLNFKNNQYYEKTQNAVFTTYVTVSETTVVNLIIKVRGAAGLPAKCDQLFPVVKVNGSEEGVCILSNPNGIIDWNNTGDAYVATIILEAGVNEIEFTRDGSNINILGVAFESATPVTLGKN